jgi:hypothetical protein
MENDLPPDIGHQASDLPPDRGSNASDLPPDRGDSVYQSYLTSKQIQPDKAAQIVKLADQSGQEPAHVEQHLEQYQAASDTLPPDHFDAMKDTHPNTYQTLSDPKVMAQASDTESIKGAQKLEEHVQKFNVINTLSDVYKTVSDPELWLRELPDYVAGSVSGNEELQGMLRWSNELTSSILSVPGLINQDWNKNGAEEWFNKNVLAQTPNPQSFAGKLGEAVLPTVGALSLGATGQLSKIPKLFAGQEFLESHQQALNQGANQAQAFTSSSVKAGLTYLLTNASTEYLTEQAHKMIEKVGLNATKQLMSRIGIKLGFPMLFMGGIGATQRWGNAFADTVTGINPNALRTVGKDILNGVPFDMTLGALLSLPAVGAVATGGVRGGPGLETAPIKPEFEKETNENEKAFIKEMGSKSQDIPAFKRNADVIGEFIKSNVKDTPHANVYVSAKAWNEFHQNQGINPEEAAKTVGAEGYEESKIRPETANLKISMENWVKHISGKPIEEALMNDVKLSESVKTTNEISNEPNPEKEHEQPKGNKIIEGAKNIINSIKGKIFPGEKEITKSPEEQKATEITESVQKELGFSHEPIKGLPDTFNKEIENAKSKATNKVEKDLVKEQEKEKSPDIQKEYLEKQSRLTEFAERKMEHDRRVIALNNFEKLSIDAKKYAGMILNDSIVPPHVRDAFEIETQQGKFVDQKDLAKQIMDFDKKKEINDLVENQMTPMQMRLQRFAYEAQHEKDSIKALALEGSYLKQMALKNPVLASPKETIKSEMEKTVGKIIPEAPSKEAVEELKRQLKVEAEIKTSKMIYDADQTLKSKSYKESTKAGLYYTAERKAWLASKMAGKDLQAAWKAKDEQALNATLAHRAEINKTDVAKFEKVVKKYAGRGNDLMGLPVGHARTLDTILEGMGIKPKSSDATNINLARKLKYDKVMGYTDSEITDRTGIVPNAKGPWTRETIDQFVSRIAPGERNLQTIITPDIISAMKKPKDQLTLNEAIGIRDSMLAIAKDGIGKTFGTKNEYKEGLKTEGLRLVAQLEKQFGNRYKDQNERRFPDNAEIKEGDNKAVIAAKLALKNAKKLFDMGCQFGDELAWQLSVARLVDGGEDGPYHQNIYRVLSHAEDNFTKNHGDMIQKLLDITKKHYVEGELSKMLYARMHHFDFGGKEGLDLSHEQCRNFAFNMGNESNERRVLNGYKITREQADKILDVLDKKDLDYCQDVGNLIEEKWPDIVDLEQNARGITPEEIQRRPLVTKHGVYDGWYYPAEYDHKLTTWKEEIKDTINSFRTFNASKAYTNRDFAKNRVYTTDKPLRLDSQVLFGHIEEVERDLAYREPLIDIQRFIAQPEVRKGIEDNLGKNSTTNLRDWISYIAYPKRTEGAVETKILNPVYKTFLLKDVAFRPMMAALKGASDMGSGMKEDGIQGYLNHQGKFIGDAIKSGGFNIYGGTNPIIDKINNLSSMMKNRSTGFDVDPSNLKELYTNSYFDKANRYAFSPEMIADRVNAYADWWGKYNESMKKYNGDEQKSIDVANEMVKTNYGTGSHLERTWVQRGAVGKTFSPAYSFMGMVYQKLWSTKQLAGLEYNKGNVLIATQIISSAVMYLAYQSATEHVVRALFKNTAENLKYRLSNAKEWGKDIARVSVGSIPMLGNIAEYEYDRHVLHKPWEYHASIVDGVYQWFSQGAGAIPGAAKDFKRFAETGHFHMNEKDLRDLSQTTQMIAHNPEILNLWLETLLYHRGALRWQDFTGFRPRNEIQ